MKLSTRLALVFSALGLGVVSAVAGLSWWLAADAVRSSIDDELLRRAGFVGQFPPRGDRGLVPPEARRAELDEFGSGEYGLQLFDEAGEPVIEPVFDVDPSSLTDANLGADPTMTTVETESHTFRIATVAIDLTDTELDGEAAYLQFFRDVTDEERALSSLAVRLAATSVAAVVAVAAASWFVGRRLAKPLDEVSAAATRLAELDDLPGRIEVDRRDEIGRLARSFNRVLAALEVGREQQRRLVANASHELRTPLTSLRMRTEFLAGTDHIDSDHQKELLQSSVADVEHLSAMVGELVDLASPNQADEAPQRVVLSDLAVEVAHRMELASGRVVAVAGDSTEAVVRPNMVRRAIHNLIDNALKHSEAPAPVTVSVDAGRVEVTDRGSGIAEEDIDYVFERFYRSRETPTMSGTGLGLAIVASVADAHGGRVWAENDPAGGGRVGFSVGVDES